MQWYYEIDRQRQGPIDQPEFDRLVNSGTIAPATLIWREGMTDWQPYSALNAAGVDSEVCVVSGKIYPKREMVQFEGKWISAEHRDLYFQRLREGVTAPGTFVYGNFWPRFAAKIIDGLILFVVGMIINVTLGIILLGSANYIGGLVSAPHAARVQFQVLTNLLGIGLGLSYGIYFIRKYSATPGKMALGLKLVRSDGSRLSVGRIVGRHFAEWLSGMILLIGYIMAAFDDERRALHDRICDTRVVRAK